MAKLNEQEIKDILTTKGLICLNIEEYKNLESILYFSTTYCKQTKRIVTTIDQIKKPFRKT